MKIGFVYDLLYPVTFGGIEKRLWELGTRLARRGHDIHLFPMSYWGAGPTSVRAGLVVHGVCALRCLHARTGRRSVRQALTYSAALFRALRGRDLDVIDCQAPAYLPCVSSAAAAKLNASDTAVVITWHEIWGRYWIEYLGWLGWGAVLLEKLCGRLTEHHVVVSPHAAARLDALGVQSRTLVPNGVDLKRVWRTHAVAEHWDIVYVGRLTREKNVGLLLDALNVLKGRGLSPSCVIVGDGPERPRLEGRALELDLHTVHFAGQLASDDDVVDVLHAARAFAMPSIREGFGIAALEAAACGVPVVTVDHDRNAAKALVTPGIDGFVTEARPVPFAEGLAAILEHDDWAGLSRRARERAEVFDWETFVDDLERFYEAACVRKSRKRGVAHA